ncbi:hypothetical protein AMS68_006793 [Peltaster fructicola]|uniref:Uncharacterized protein n=1 Tax=Peltaster fructicola TaxID=286661 RepID=A0A6H0Y2U9_9PEZI|nr:hypothetical protein AMS68_006793 [Peltaster fructicola]
MACFTVLQGKIFLTPTITLAIHASLIPDHTFHPRNMSFYDNDNAWSAQGRQPSWEQQIPSRSGASSALSQHQAHTAEPNAFAAQFEEIERATDNLARSGKWFPGGASGPGGNRRDSTTGGRNQDNGEQRGSRHNDFDNGRPGSSGLQGYYQGQRFPSRQSEAEQVLHAKRRMAAQRERELRNYHQEQQYNRNASSAKSDRSMSPNTMSEEDRRDLIARQHRALYGDNSSLYNPDGSARAKSQDVRSVGRGPSPLAFDQYGSQAQPGADGQVSRDRTESTASPAAQQALGETQQRTSTTSPGASPPHQSGPRGSSVAPIGTRPPQGAPGMNKRATTPLTPSSLGYGYSGEPQGANLGKDEHAAAATTNSSLSGDKVGPLGGNWGSNSGVWGKSTLNSQASVWG